MMDERTRGALRRMLNDIAEMCEHCSLTGSLAGGTRQTARRYNTVLKQLSEANAIPVGLFSEVSEAADYSEIGVEARMLGSYLSEDKDKHRRNRSEGVDRNVLVRLAPFVHKEELGMLLKEHARSGGELDMDTVSQLAPFLGSDVLGGLLRDYLASRMASTPTSAAATEHSKRANSTDLAIFDSEAVDSSEDSIEQLLEMLKSPYIADQDRNTILARLKRLTGGMT